MDLTTAQEYARSAMPRLLEQHAEIVSHKSIAFPGYPKEPMDAIIPVLLDLFRSQGVENVDVIQPGGYPAIHALIPGPEGSPVVTMYAHYDVQPVPAAQAGQWKTDPWVATKGDDGRIYGRGAADDKSGVITLAGILGAFKDGGLPCTVRLLIEGEEETGGHLEEYVENHPDEFRSDFIMITDSGPAKVGTPQITTGLRGTVSTRVEIRTMASAIHSGLFGGAAPDALFAMIKMLGSMYDDAGNTVIEGLTSFDWEGGSVEEADVLKNAEVAEGVSLMGDGPVASRLWSRPAVTVIGLDAVPTDQCSNALNPSAKAAVSLRIAPGADPRTELETLKQHLRDHAPLGVEVVFSEEEMGAPFLADVSGPYVTAALKALEESHGVAPGQAGTGGSIPLVTVLASIAPNAEILIWGPQDEEFSKIHGPNESVDPTEIERCIVAGVRMLSMIGEGQG